MKPEKKDVTLYTLPLGRWFKTDTDECKMVNIEHTTGKVVCWSVQKQKKIKLNPLTPVDLMPREYRETFIIPNESN